ncbi:putative NAC domain-containing protein 73 isoform X2 [Sesbania bispinosa]|nr:putative NAC domain-containing protein 73 isoform X2 [Sesbania bispinosa]
MSSNNKKTIYNHEQQLNLSSKICGQQQHEERSCSSNTEEIVRSCSSNCWETAGPIPSSVKAKWALCGSVKN